MEYFLRNLSYLKVLKNKKYKKLKIYNDFNSIHKILKKKLHYCMCAITGLAGLEPTLSCIKHSKKIAIANKAEFLAPAFPIAKVATGTPAGIRTVE